MLIPATLNLALIGFGHVGRRFAGLLNERRHVLDGLGLHWKIVGIATGRHGCSMDPQGVDIALALDTVLRGERLSADGPDTPLDSHQLIRTLASRLSNLVVVETTPLDVVSGEPAIAHVREALEAGAHVVTANKGPIALAYHDLADLARRMNRAFLFEGAVMDGIPVFNLVRETMPAVEILGFRGVVNSTTNHMLTAMEAGRSFEESLEEMQRAGIAEADASHDIDGWDAAAKTAALANVMMGVRLTPQMIDRTGIREVDGGEVRAISQSGRRLRLVASATRRGHQIQARVAPTVLEAGDPLATLTGTQNALILDTNVLGEVGIFQLTGGLQQTAYALLSDLVTIGRRIGAI